MDIQELIKEFRSRLTLPDQKAARPFLLGIVGQLGSGKSTLARMLAARLPGSIVLRADSARFLLKERGMSWGDNVRALVRDVAEGLVKDGYGVILDGSNAEVKEREQNAELALRLGIPIYYVRIRASLEVCRERLKAKYDDSTLVSSFERFRVNTTEKMLANLEERRALHDSLKDEDIMGLVGTVSNDRGRVELERQTESVAKHIIEVLA